MPENFLRLMTGHFFISYTFLASFSYNKTWIRVERNREQHTLDLHMGIPWENVTLTALGRNKALYFQILDEGMYCTE